MIDWVNYLETSVHDHRHQFVRAYVQEYWFNLEKKGSSPAEANHSSYVARIGPVSVEEPAIMVEKTLIRHSDICKERNELIVRYRAECIARAATEHMEQQDKIALLTLSMWGYELWLTARMESPNYECIVRDKEKVVRRKGFTEGGREIGSGTKCNCRKRKAFKSQCTHLVKGNDGMFILELWDVHWLQRPLLRKASAPEDEAQRLEDDFLVSESQHGVDHDNEETDQGYEADCVQQLSNTSDDNAGRLEVRIPSNQDAAQLLRRDQILPLADASSVNFNDIMVICKDLASFILKRKDIPTQVGMLLQWTQNLRSVPQGTDLQDATDFEEIFNVHMSAFSRHKSSTTNLFTATQKEDGVLQAEPLRSQGPPREQGGRLKRKRLKSNQEKAVRGLPIALSQSTPRIKACSFCCLTGHNKGTAACDAYTALRSTFLIHDTDFQRWSTGLGDSRLHLVESPSQAERRLFHQIDFDAAVIPPEVHHVVLVKCFYSKEHVEYMSTRMSQYREIGRNNLAPPSMEYNVVEVILLVKGAQSYEDSGSSCFMYVKTVREWIVSNFKKTSKKFVLNRLPKAALNNIANTY
jgi:hypothetical protein